MGFGDCFKKQLLSRTTLSRESKLDNKINTILYHLEYLCNTIDGIPFDELSDYVSTNLAEKGAEKFKNELIILGKS